MSFLRVKMAIGETLTIRADDKHAIETFGEALSANTSVIVDGACGQKLWINPAHVAYIEEKPNA